MQNADDVVSRLATAMESMEVEYQGCAILVVSHGDPLQMLHNILHSAKQHRGGFRFSSEVSDEQSCFRLVSAPQVCFATRRKTFMYLVVYLMDENMFSEHTQTHCLCATKPLGLFARV